MELEIFPITFVIAPSNSKNNWENQRVKSKSTRNLQTKLPKASAARPGTQDCAFIGSVIISFLKLHVITNPLNLAQNILFNKIEDEIKKI